MVFVFKSIFTHLTRFFSKSKVSIKLIILFWSTEPNAFSISTVTSKPLVFEKSVISRTSEIIRLLSLIYILPTYAVRFEKLIVVNFLKFFLLKP